MEFIYSKIEKGKILHRINRFNEVKDRQNLCSNESFIQCATYKKNKGLITKPHIHIERQVESHHYVTQESWVIIQGSISVILFDVDGSFLCTYELHKGDICITFYGGHTFDVLENDTIIYEFKSGPYVEGLDKKNIIENEDYKVLS
jgi:cupin fold WbuC family metalloprotein